MFRRIVAAVLAVVVIGALGGLVHAENIAHRQRAASLEAKRAVEAGDLDAARETLIAAWALDRSAMYLREQLSVVNRLIIAEDSRKAHVLHGREGPGGELEPEDLMP